MLVPFEPTALSCLTTASVAVLKAGWDTSIRAGRCYALWVGPTEASSDAPVRTGSGSATRHPADNIIGHDLPPGASVGGKGAL